MPMQTHHANNRLPERQTPMTARGGSSAGEVSSRSWATDSAHLSAMKAMLEDFARLGTQERELTQSTLQSSSAVSRVRQMEASAAHEANSCQTTPTDNAVNGSVAGRSSDTESGGLKMPYECGNGPTDGSGEVTRNPHRTGVGIADSPPDAAAQYGETECCGARSAQGSSPREAAGYVHLTGTILDAEDTGGALDLAEYGDICISEVEAAIGAVSQTLRDKRTTAAHQDNKAIEGLVYQVTARHDPDTMDMPAIIQAACTDIAGKGRHTILSDKSIMPADAVIQPEDWVHLIDVQTQAKLILHVHKKQTADQDVVRLMRENNNNYSQNHLQLSPSVRCAMAEAAVWHDRCCDLVAQIHSEVLEACSQDVFDDDLQLDKEHVRVCAAMAQALRDDSSS